MLSARSSTSAPISTASTPSPIISPASLPTIPTPRIRRVSVSMTIVVSPAESPIDAALPEADQGKRATSTFQPRSRASVSVSPHQAI
jgi:hypothetical protein